MNQHSLVLTCSRSCFIHLQPFQAFRNLGLLRSFDANINRSTFRHHGFTGGKSYGHSSKEVTSRRCVLMFGTRITLNQCCDPLRLVIVCFESAYIVQMVANRAEIDLVPAQCTLLRSFCGLNLSGGSTQRHDFRCIYATTDTQE